MDAIALKLDSIYLLFLQYVLYTLNSLLSVFPGYLSFLITLYIMQFVVQKAVVSLFRFDAKQGLLILSFN